MKSKANFAAIAFLLSAFGILAFFGGLNISTISGPAQIDQFSTR